MFYLTSTYCLAVTEPLDTNFLEWLGQVAEVEELGMDIDELLIQQELQEKSEENEDTTQ